MGTYLYVSCRNEAQNARGIGNIQFNLETGEMSEPLLQEETLYMGGLAYDRPRRVLYATNMVEKHPDYPVGGGGLVWAYDVDQATGILTRKSRADACTPNPCALTVSEDGKFLVCVSNSGFGGVTKVVPGEDGMYHPHVEYDDAFVGVFQLNEEGEILGLKEIHKHDSFRVRSAELHARPHSVKRSPRLPLMACSDKGDAHLYMYQLDEEGRPELLSEPFADTTGTAPGCLCFHPEKNLLYMNHERDFRISSFVYASDGSLTPLGETYVTGEGMNHAVGQRGMCLSKDGKHLYDVVMGNDLVAVFTVEPDGRLTQQGLVKVEGKGAMGAELSPNGRFLVVTCFESGDVLCYRLSETGSPTKLVSHVELPGAFYPIFANV